MKIGLDAMGGDFAPDKIVKGAVMAQKELTSTDDRIVLIGHQNRILEKLEENNADSSLFDIVDASDVIGMGEQPTRAFTQKPDSSITKGFRMLKTGHIDSFASAGNTGAMLVGSIYSVNVVQGIIRPATTSVLPKENGAVGVLIDVGTNPDSKPDVLYQFGLLGSIYAQYVHGIKNPKVGLLNIGEEEEKGNLLCQSAFRLMKDTQDYNFIGNIESRDLFNDRADVIVCDGFTGNMVLKQAEAMYRLIKKRGIKDEFFDRMNYENYGGTPILGVNGTVIIGHGISNEIAIKNMVLLSKEVFEAKVPEKISDLLSRYTQSKAFNGKS
ncbi:MAG: phosphate acyltransferase PlsX [Bacteroidetes bacterium]|nr:MAG: phosphate acyltransferase PlsX [Bacteroidota bacterium]